MEILEKLRENNLKATPQRVAILKYLNERNHPNIDEIYSKIREEFVSISLATIYKNLNTLKERGVIFEINSSESKVRYDLNTTEHIHSKCPKCGKIEDIFSESILREFKESLSIALNREILNTNLLINSYCRECN